ncbi:MAG: hypothetical protein ABSA79_10265 [Candidatus Bathyarchaeia archaeon]
MLDDYQARRARLLQLDTPNVDLVFFTFVFITSTLLTQTMNKHDLENLRGMVSGLGIIGRIVNLFLT